MDPIDLPPARQRLLVALVDEFQSTESPVTSDDIGAAVDRAPETVRTQMGSLVDLGLAEGIRGHGGGYRPTESAFELLDRADGDSAPIVLAHGYERVSATVDGITFPNVHHPDVCRARVSFRRPVEDVDAGDPVVIGPTPGSKLVVAGTVEAVDPSDNAVYLSVSGLEAPLDPAE